MSLINISARRGQAGMPRYVSGEDWTPDTLKLASNENAWGASPRAIAAMREALGEVHRYPDSSYSRLRAALAAREQVEVETIAVAAGSEQLITLLVAAYAGPGDEVLVSQHGFALLPIAARMANATPVAAPDRGLAADVDGILGAVTGRTRIVALATPNNPTGTALSAAEIVALRDDLPDTVLLILDLAYAEFGDAEATRAAHRLARDRRDTIVLRTFSKAYGLAGARVGWAHGCPALLAPLARLRPPFPITRLAQVAAIAALGDEPWLARTSAAMATARASFGQGLEDLGLELCPSVTNFLLARFDSAEAASSALDACAKQGVILRPLAMYGLHDCLRLSVGLDHECERVIQTLAEWKHR